MFHCNYCYLTLKYFYSSFPAWRWIKINKIRILKCFYSTTGRKRWIKTLKNPDWVCHNSCMTGLNGQRATAFTGKLFLSSAVSPKPADPTFMIQNRLSETSVLKPAFKLDPGVWAETLRFLLPRFTDTSVTPGNHRAVDKHLGHSWFLKQVDTCWNIITMVTLKWCYWWRLSAVSFSWHQQASIDAAAQQEWFAISVHAWLMSPSLNRFRVNEKQIWHKCLLLLTSKTLCLCWSFTPACVLEVALQRLSQDVLHLLDHLLDLQLHLFTLVCKTNGRFEPTPLPGLTCGAKLHWNTNVTFYCILFASYRLWCRILSEPLLIFLHDGENTFHLSCFYSETSGSRGFLLSEMCCPLVTDSYITS